MNLNVADCYLVLAVSAHDLCYLNLFPKFSLINDKPTDSIFYFSVDNSEYMRNGDFIPSRLQAQQDAVNMVCHSKTRSNPENNVGLLTLAK